jgi:hypothetical protein
LVLLSALLVTDDLVPDISFCGQETIAFNVALKSASPDTPLRLNRHARLPAGVTP